MAAENAGKARRGPRKPPATPQQRAILSPPVPPAQVRLSWLLTALALLVVAALCCAYLSLCLLFLQGQWQILYHPSHVVSATPSARGLPYTPLSFSPDDAGKPQLTGWWVPVAPVAPVARCTVLYLHDAAGSLGDTVAALPRLHALGCDLLAIDYRGFGASAPAQPSESSMLEDVRHALSYLEETRHIAPRSILLWGQGVGATLAAEAAQPPAGFGGLVMEDVNEPARVLLSSDPRTRWLPLRLLQRDRLDPARALASEPMPKLFLAGAPQTMQDAPPSSATVRLFLRAAPPRLLLPSDSAAGIKHWLEELEAGSRTSTGD